MNRQERKTAEPSPANGAGATTADPRWAAVLARDAAADGRFVYSVRTTGIYCRPSCGSRRARPENVRFHADAAAAERAGFRACLRCRPDRHSPSQEQAERIARACRAIEAAETPPSLDALARIAGLSAFHFHRTFKAVTGLTPRAYAAAQRGRRLRERLDPARGARTVTEAIFDAGFNSSARAYAHAPAELGMTPSAYRAGGIASRIRFAVGQCSLGAILVAQSARGLCAILLGDDPDTLVRDLQDRFPKPSSAAAMRTSSASSRPSSASSSHRASGSHCRSTYAARPSSNASGRRCAACRPARPSPTRSSRVASARRTRRARSPAHAPPMPSPSLSPAIA